VPATKLYQVIADELSSAIRDGTLRAGERLPSVRLLCMERKVSPATVLRAYNILETQSLVETRERSGYYVRAMAQRSLTVAPKSQPTRSGTRATRVEINELVFQILGTTRAKDIVPLGSAFPSPTLFPWAKLSRYLGSSARQMDPMSTVQSLPPGSEELRRQIARRYLHAGMSVPAEEIIITSGALEALTLSLQVVTQPGDTVAVESPTFYACLQAIETYGLRAVEIPTDPTNGIDLDALVQVVTKHNIKACWFMTTLQNPLGTTLIESKKRALINLLAAHDIPLIEDDVYAELQFMPTRPAKAFDGKGLVLHCGSFSKCLAPGYRLGWVAAGRYAEQVQRRKVTTSLGTSMPIQLGIAQMLSQGGYDAHLSRLRATLAKQQQIMLSAINKYFPAECRVTPPSGGYFLWIELPARVDSLEVHRQALEVNISIAPGPMFSARRAFGHYIRLNYGHPWTPAIEHAVCRLGQIIKRISQV
jgi:DNA-binding transcriptional MocR family regulator